MTNFNYVFLYVDHHRLVQFSMNVVNAASKCLMGALAIWNCPVMWKQQPWLHGDSQVSCCEWFSALPPECSTMVVALAVWKLSQYLCESWNSGCEVSTLICNTVNVVFMFSTAIAIIFHTAISVPLHWVRSVHTHMVWALWALVSL